MANLPAAHRPHRQAESRANRAELMWDMGYI